MAQNNEFLIQCPQCSGEHDALQAIWCSCDPQNPSKLCPYCLTCFCEADPSFAEWFWDNAPKELLDERAALKETRMLLGDMLVRAGVITTDQLLQGLKLQKREGGKLGDSLVSLGLLTKERIDEFLRMQQSVVSFDLDRVLLDLALIRQVGVEFCRRKLILPLEKETFKNRTLLTLAMANPADTETINRVQKMSGCQVVAGRAPEEDILASLRTHFPEELPPLEGEVVEDGLVSSLQEPSVDPELTRLASRLLRTGLERGADAMEIAEEDGEVRVRFRIGGRVYRAGHPPTTDPGGLLQAVRAMASSPVEGRGTIRVLFAGGEVDVALHESGERSLTIDF